MSRGKLEEYDVNALMSNDKLNIYSHLYINNEER